MRMLMCVSEVVCVGVKKQECSLIFFVPQVYFYQPTYNVVACCILYVDNQFA